MSKLVLFLTILEAYRVAQKEIILSSNKTPKQKQTELDLLNDTCDSFEKQYKEGDV